MSQITTITLFKYRGFWSKIWAFGMMQFAHSPLKKVDGLQFYKLWGSGKENFNPLPDWSVYALLQIWDKEESAQAFFRSEEHTSELQSLTNLVCRLLLEKKKKKIS